MVISKTGKKSQKIVKFAVENFEHLRCKVWRWKFWAFAFSFSLQQSKSKYHFRFAEEEQEQEEEQPALPEAQIQPMPTMILHQQDG